MVTSCFSRWNNRRPDRLWTALQVRTQTFEASIVVVAHVRIVFVSLRGDLSKRQTFEEEHLDGPSLRLGQYGERLPCEAYCFLRLQPGRQPVARSSIGFA